MQSQDDDCRLHLSPADPTDAVAALVAAAPAAAPLGRPTDAPADRTVDRPLDPDALRRMRSATRAVLDDRAGAARAEVERFRATGSRMLDIDQDRVRQAHAGRTVLVTGGTGCIGSVLVRLLRENGAARVVSISRGRTVGWPRTEGVEYRRLDVRQRDAVRDLMAELRPDIVYHVAAQHDPGLAEQFVARTVSTNVTGTVNVVDACRSVGGMHLAFASTGKALRPFSRDVYAGSKKISEWIMRNGVADTGAGADLTGSAVRFTHIVDNSIIHRRLRDWCAGDAVVRLHDAGTMFYVQSALEAAQLLMGSVLDAAPDRLGLDAITDLGWPVSLLDLAVGVIAETGSSSAIHVCGHDPGYERSPYPALYDPLASGERSPLFSSFEVADLVDAPGCQSVDRLRLRPLADQRAQDGLTALTAA
uniref:NAD-dependent epimerase/dehydratase family protein n=1 Tax=Nakamurella sp. TaxID=1869182 RepID=UPI003B3ADDB7